MFDASIPAESSSELVLRLDSRKLCDAQQKVNATFLVADFQGLCSYLASETGKVEVTLGFDRDDFQRPIVSGKIEAKGVEMVCQRCLQVAQFDVHSDVHIAIVVNEEQAHQLPPEYDAWEVTDGQLNMRELLDQELVLSLPIVPYHQDCQVQTEYGDRGEWQANSNPFRVLAYVLEKKSFDKD